MTAFGAGDWPYRLGCPVWASKTWNGGFYTPDAGPGDWLAQYSSVFGTVEGNASFYGLPAPATVARWAQDAAPGFRFCFKVPRAITHEARLIDCRAATAEFLDRLAPLAARDALGPLLLQLPPDYGPDGLARLLDWLDALPAGRTCAVEMRHPCFYDRSPAERALNRALHERGIDRATMDTRGLFSATDADPATREARRKKPRLPARALALGPRPFVRYVGHPVLARNGHWLAQWAGQFATWITEGREPWFFAHMPDDRDAPALARAFHEELRSRIASLPALPPWPAGRLPQQSGLFGGN